MSLTNPNKIVTEERLSEFYQDILPYLGGMPEILANKFSKGDLYSTDEKIIGVWTDGRPLYQRVVTGNSINANDGWKQIASLGTNCVIVRAESYISDDNIRWIPAGYNTGIAFEHILNFANQTSTNGDYSVYTSGSMLKNKPVIAILQYTKTTDSAISIGVDTDYSTTEKIVGTWIDGKYLYQKVVTTNGAVPSGATLIHREAMASTGYDTIQYTKTS